MSCLSKVNCNLVVKIKGFIDFMDVCFVWNNNLKLLLISRIIGYFGIERIFDFNRLIEFLRWVVCFFYILSFFV